MSETRLRFIHDMRNKIAPILIHAQLIQLQADKMKDGADVLDSAKSIEDAAKDMIDFIDKVEHESDSTKKAAKR